jgi:hypothetical protein
MKKVKLLDSDGCQEVSKHFILFQILGSPQEYMSESKNFPPCSTLSSSTTEPAGTVVNHIAFLHVFCLQLSSTYPSTLLFLCPLSPVLVIVMCFCFV